MCAAGFERRLPVGAEVTPGGGVHFRVWAPRRKRVEVVVEKEGGGESARVELAAGDEGYFSARGRASFAVKMKRGRTRARRPRATHSRLTTDN